MSNYNYPGQPRKTLGISNRNYVSNPTSFPRRSETESESPHLTVPVLDKDSPGLFSDDAEQAAKSCSRCSRCSAKNNPSQLRRFYDEIVAWNDKISKDENDRQNRFNDALPYIQMIRAKAAYARGRNLIDDNFHDLIQGLVRQVNTPEKLTRAKLFLEAFMGYFKYYTAK